MATQDWEKIKRMRLWERNGNPGLGEDQEDEIMGEEWQPRTGRRSRG